MSIGDIFSTTFWSLSGLKMCSREFVRVPRKWISFRPSPTISDYYGLFLEINKLLTGIKAAKTRSRIRRRDGHRNNSIGQLTRRDEVVRVVLRVCHRITPELLSQKS